MIPPQGAAGQHISRHFGRCFANTARSSLHQLVRSSSAATPPHLTRASVAPVGWATRISSYRQIRTPARHHSSSNASSSPDLKPRPSRTPHNQHHQQQYSSSSASGSSSSTASPAAPMAAATSKPPVQTSAQAAARAATSAADVLQLFAGAMPKAEIGAVKFLQKYPEYDGRGVVVAIFDTGVDPSASGLQVTTDGKPKIIDVIDCTGSGDIDTSTVTKADEAGFINGGSGRRLKLNPSWRNPSGEWHVGCRRLFELFPKTLQKRVKDQRKKAFDEAQRKALADTAAALAAAATSSKPGGAAAAAGGKSSAVDGDKGAVAAAAAPAAVSKSELEARLSYLQESYKNYDDPGPVVDCVIWHDGSTWRVALDTSDMYPCYNNVSNNAQSNTAAEADLESQAARNAAEEEAAAGDPDHAQQQQQRQQGLLADFEPLADYAVEQQYGVFSTQDCCAYAVKVYDDGNTLSVVVDAGAHGTHVAGIVAAHYPEDPAANGIAPGAQIISCKIGDSRLGSMETGTGLVRALIAVMNAGADIINMSYGEPTARPEVGRAIEVATEAVNKAGVIFVASAGNAGPALSTVGAPGGTSSALLGVGAYVSPDLAAAGHSLRGDLAAGQQYTWSSRGPTADGDTGVVLSAPGGAVAPVPAWTLQKRQLMNGTSMASPCAAGGLTLLLSGLKALGASGGSSRDGLQWTSPARVRRAVEATCQPLGGSSPDAVLTYGRGLLQVDAAFDYLLKSAEADLPDTRYAVGVSGGPGCTAGLGTTRRGIYMRQPHEAVGPASYTVTVAPHLHEEASVADKLAVEDHLMLTCSAPWVSAPALLLLHHNGRSFEVKVDPSKLSPGLHYAEVQGVSPAAAWRGPLFRVPITVIKPQNLMQTPDIDAITTEAMEPAAEQTPATFEFGVSGDTEIASAQAGFGVVSSNSSSAWGAWGGADVATARGAAAGGPENGGLLPPHTLRLGPLKFAPGLEQRQFVAVPAGATWAEMAIKAGPYETPKLFMVRATQLLPDVRFTDSQYTANITLSPNSEYSAAFKVVGDATLELTLSQFWSNLGSSSIEVEVSFFGLTAEPVAAVAGGGSGGSMVLDAAAGPLKVMISSPLRRQRIKPEAKLTRISSSVRPKDSQLEPLLDPRDCLPGGRVTYRLVLSYAFSISEGGKYKPLVPLTNRYLYDSPLESQLTQVFDANKRLLYTGDAIPEEVSLAKGDYTARVMLRHDQISMLDKLKGTCLVLSRKLESPVSVPVYSSIAAATTGGSAAGEAFLSGGDMAVLWLGPPPEDKLPKDAAGRVLEGSLSLGQLRSGSGPAPAAVPFTFLPAPPAAAAKKNGDASSPPAKPATVRLSEAVRDAKLALLKDLKEDVADDQEVAESLAAELLAEAPEHLPLLLLLMKRQDSAAKGDARAAQLPALISAADRVIAAINTTELAAFMALRPPADVDDDQNSSSDSTSSSNPAADAAGTGGSLTPTTQTTANKSYKEQKAEKDAAKAALTDALKVKLKAQLEQVEATPAEAVGAIAAEVAATAAQLRQWVDTAADKDCLLLHAKVEAAAGRFAPALSACDKLMAPADEAPGPAAAAAATLKQQLLQQLGWQHWNSYEAAWAKVRFPEKLPPL